MFIEIIVGVRTLLGYFGELVGATFHKVFLIKRLSLAPQHAIYVRVDVVACLLLVSNMSTGA